MATTAAAEPTVTTLPARKRQQTRDPPPRLHLLNTNRNDSITTVSASTSRPLSTSSSVPTASPITFSASEPTTANSESPGFPNPLPSPLNHLSYSAVPSHLLAFFQSRTSPVRIDPLPPPISSPLVIPSSSATLSSGFPFPTPLATNDIAPRDWAIFSNSIANAGRLSKKEKGLAMTKGISRGVLMLGGVKKAQKAAEQERKKMEVRRVLGCRSSTGHGAGGDGEKRDVWEIVESKKSGGVSGQKKKESELDLTLRLWNQWFFNPRGVIVRVEPPKDIMESTVCPEAQPTPASKPSQPRSAKKRLSLDGLSFSISFSSPKSCGRKRSASAGTNSTIGSAQSMNVEEGRREWLNRFRVILLPYKRESEEGSGKGQERASPIASIGGKKGKKQIPDAAPIRSASWH